MKAAIALLLCLAGCGDVRLSVGCRLALGDSAAVALLAFSVPVRGEAVSMCSRVEIADLDEGDED